MCYKLETCGIIGEGGYGKIYYVTLTNSKGSETKAMKCILPSSKNGLNSIMEVFIQRYVKSDYLVDSKCAEIDKNGRIRIIQDIFVGDLRKIVCKNQHSPSPQVLKRWCWELLCAVNHLHETNILHGDIKASNVLLCSDKEEVSAACRVLEKYSRYLEGSHIKLADFGLSVFLPSSKHQVRSIDDFMHYTTSHRAPEVWSKTGWSLPADVWALGCTFYEFAYGCAPFGELKCENPIEHIENVVYRKIRVSEKSEFNEMLQEIFTINPLKRISLYRLMSHSYFRDIASGNNFSSHYSYYLNLLNARKIKHLKMADLVENKTLEELKSFTSDREVLRFAYNLTLKDNNQATPSAYVSLAQKLLYAKSEIQENHISNHVDICNRLKFMFLGTPQ
jgi:serine/threonine protein kinase